MIDRTINSLQVHYRGIPAHHGDENSPGSIIEHFSTSMRVTLLRANVISDSSLESNYELFNADPNTIEKTQMRFYDIARKEFRERVKIDSFQKVKLVIPRSSTEIGQSEKNIRLEVWPKIFVCDDCGLIYAPDRDEQRSITDAGVFRECPCGGDFRQSPHILLCKICGSVRHIPYKCIDCGNPLHLMKGSEVDVETWKLECNNGHVHEFGDYPDCYTCDNEDQLLSDERHKEISKGKQVGRSVMTTVGRGICTPLTVRFPIGRSYRALQIEEKMLVAGNSHLLDLKKIKNIERASPDFDKGGEIYEDKRDELSSSSRGIDVTDLEELLAGLPADGRNHPPSRREYAEMQRLCNYTVRGFDFGPEIEKSDLLTRCDDWITLMSGVPAKGVKDLNDLAETAAIPNEDVAKIKKNLKVMQIRYIENVSIISGTYGVIRGSIHPIYNRETQDPVKIPLDGVAYGKGTDDRIQICKNDARGLPVIVTKRDTEALAFILEAKGIVNVIAREKPDIWHAYTKDETDPSDLSELDARAWLMYASHGKEHGETVSRYARTIVHTISHALIHRFPKSSGLRDSDLGELLYPEFCGFVIYNGLEIPLGMLKRVFKDNLRRLLDEEILGEMRDCDMDPTCREQGDGAACHACLHIPDHVCQSFNEDLDRRLLIDEKGYWR